MERLDGYYMQIAKEVGGIRELIDSFFGFLLRRTDFFYEADPGDNMGFPPGAAEGIVVQVFRACQEQHHRRHPKKSYEEYRAKKSHRDYLMKQAAAEQKAAEPAALPPAAAPRRPAPDKAFSDISTFNGASTARYKWSQSATEVTVQLDLPRPAKAKDLRVTLSPTHLHIRYTSDVTPLLAGEFPHRIKAAESSWVIEDGQRVLLMLEKAEEDIWKSVLRAAPEIDATTVDNSKRLDEFDPETQGALRKVLYEQQRKQQGLPTTEEEKQMEALKAAWDSPGSPFRSTPFDSSRINLSQGP